MNTSAGMNMLKLLFLKLVGKVGMLGLVCHYITLHNANAIYISMIRLILEYCAGAWACCGEVNSVTLAALQKRKGRMLIKTSSSDTAMEALNGHVLGPGTINISLSL